MRRPKASDVPTGTEDGAALGGEEAQQFPEEPPGDYWSLSHTPTQTLSP